MGFLRSFVKRFEAGDRFLNALVLVSCVRFSGSFVNDVLWYGTPLERALRAVLLALFLSAAWLFRPGAEIEEKTEE